MESLKVEVENILRFRPGVDVDVYKISNLSIQLLQLYSTLKEEMETALRLYVTQRAGTADESGPVLLSVDRDNCRNSVKRFNEIKILKKRWDKFWKEILSYAL